MVKDMGSRLTGAALRIYHFSHQICKSLELSSRNLSEHMIVARRVMITCSNPNLFLSNQTVSSQNHLSLTPTRLFLALMFTPAFDALVGRDNNDGDLSYCESEKPFSHRWLTECGGVLIIIRRLHFIFCFQHGLSSSIQSSRLLGFASYWAS
jgi:hypothetical protein